MPQVKKKSKKEWILNPRNKTAVCILHEYLQRGMSKPPKYETSTEDSSSTPYGCTVVINDIAYGKGMHGRLKVQMSRGQSISVKTWPYIESLWPDTFTVIVRKAI